MSVNKVILIGHLGQDPELRQTNTGESVANFSLATNEHWTDKAGNKQEKTEWHRIVVWGKLADNCKQYLAKGKQAYIEGRIGTESYQDKDNKTLYTTKITANIVQFLGAASGGGNRQPHTADTLPSNGNEDGPL